jgi:hypothetical protein
VIAAIDTQANTSKTMKSVTFEVRRDVTAIDQFLENDATCLTCGSVENDFQLECSLYGTAGCSEVTKSIHKHTLAQEF